MCFSNATPEEGANKALAVAGKGCSTRRAVSSYRAVSAQPAAIPLNKRPRLLYCPVAVERARGDLSGVAALAVLRLSRKYYARACALPALLGMCNAPPRCCSSCDASRGSAGSLQWFWQSCQLRLRQLDSRPGGASDGVELPWAFEAGTRAFNDFTRISQRCEARFATPGTDIYVSGTAAAAVSLRDKTLMLLLMLWWDETHYVADCPAETPACIAALIANLK